MTAVSGFDHTKPNIDPTWPELRLGDAESFGPTFPIDTLPAVLGDAVRAVSGEIPIDFLAMPMIGTAAGAFQGVCIVSGQSHREHLSLFVTVAGDSGERKSQAHALVTGPIEAAERELRAQQRDHVERSRFERAEAERSLTGLLRRLEEERLAGRDTAQTEQLILTVQQRIPAELVEPQLLIGDTTTEAAARVLSRQRSRLVLTADECGNVFGHLDGTLHGQGQVNADAFLSGYDGRTLRIERVGQNRGAQTTRIEAPDATLTLILLPQRDLLRRLVGNPVLRARGFVPRLCAVNPRRAGPFLLPVSGQPQVAAADRPAVRRYAELMERMYCDGWQLTQPQQRAERAIVLGQPGLALWREFYNAQQHRRDEEMRDWLDKAPGRVLRIAAALHIVAWYDASLRGDGPWAEPVGEETVKAAIRIGEYLEAHARALMGRLEAEPLAYAPSVAAWLQGQHAKGRRQVSLRDVCRRGPKAVRDRDMAFQVMRLLEERGAVREVKGRQNPSEVWEVRPGLEAGQQSY